MNTREPGVLIVSPHLDDGVFSCGALIPGWMRAGYRIGIATVFTSKTNIDTPISREDNARYDGDSIAIRRAEDESAAAFLGFEVLHGDLPEVVFRNRPDGTPRCAAFDDIFGGVVMPDNANILGHTKQTIQSFIDDFMPSIICGPRARGNHTDHAIVRDALASVTRSLLITVVNYADMPYSFEQGFGDVSGSSLSQTPPTDDDLDTWINATELYASQVKSYPSDWQAAYREWGRGNWMKLATSSPTD